MREVVAALFGAALLLSGAALADNPSDKNQGAGNDPPKSAPGQTQNPNPGK